MLYNYQRGGDDGGLPDLPLASPPPEAPGDAQAQRLEELRAEFRAQEHRGRRSSEAAAVQPDGAAAEAAGEAELELRRAVPFLSPAFTCGYHDASLLLAAIQAGGASGSRETLSDKLAAHRNEIAALEKKLARRSSECEALREQVAEARGRAQAQADEHRRLSKLSAQRYEDLRRQLIMEESRSKNLQMQLKRATNECEAVKKKLHCK